MTDNMVERLAKLIGELLDDHEFDPKYYARAVLSEIEAAGMVIAPREATEAMVDAMHKEVDDLGRHYHRILYRSAVSAALAEQGEEKADRSPPPL